MRWLFVRRLRSFVMLAAATSFVLNIALLMPAIYMMLRMIGVDRVGEVRSGPAARRGRRP